MTRRALVLDANILIRAVLGKRVRQLLLDHSGDVSFFAPDVAFADAHEYLPALLEKRGVSAATAITVLDMLARVVRAVELELYQGQQKQALARIGDRDADDWPVLACALTFGCAIWTEDADFFGTGVATWTTQRVPLYLAAESD